MQEAVAYQRQIYFNSVIATCWLYFSKEPLHA